jgi:hypothetical protein
MARSNQIAKVVSGVQGRKTRLQQHERSPNTGASPGGPAWPGLGRKIGGPLTPRKPKR